MTKPLPPSRLCETSFSVRRWRVEAEAGTTKQELESAAFWALVARMMEPGNIVEVLADDMSFYAEGVVIDASEQWAKVKINQFYRYNAEEAAPLQIDHEFDVCFRGARRWSVKRKSDSFILSENHTTRESAALWMAEHVSRVAA